MKRNRRAVVVIGAGFAGLSAAAVLAKQGCEVVVLEKNAENGGRARTFEKQGFMFDRGPSWYWMPDVFDRFFNQFGRTAADFYTLKKLDPGFSVIFGKDDVIDIPGDFNELCAIFERLEPGSAVKLNTFIDKAEYKYNAGMNELVYQPGNSVTEFLKPWIIKDVFRLQLFSSFSKQVRECFKHPKLISILEFPVLFLGATPQNTPALYSLMNYAGLKVGTYYPMGGFGKVVNAFKQIAVEQGVQIHSESPVEKIEVHAGKIQFVKTKQERFSVDAVIGAADYHHIEQQLLSEENRGYSEKYWENRTMAPSCLIFYLGVNKKIGKLQHHNLFFDADIDRHAAEIYTRKQWPAEPLFYVCCPSKTDATVAPAGSENLFLLMPVAAGLTDFSQEREFYYHLLMKRLEDFTGEAIADHVIFKESYSVNNFVNDYNAFKGNAYGLANTLMQTAFMKPKLRSRKVSNLFFAGQLTVPGPGVPPSIISGQVAAAELLKSLVL